MSLVYAYIYIYMYPDAPYMDYLPEVKNGQFQEKFK